METVETAYQHTLDYIYKFIDHSLTRNLRYSEEKFDLGRMEAFMERLGNPQNDYPVIHIAGTKGKGSTGAMIASVLQAAGYKVGFYTSPHLEDYAERIQINRQKITHSELVDLIDGMKPVIESIDSISTFEITTGAAFLYFSQQAVDVAVIEVGLGGRLDATNIVDPLVSVITSLSLDHTKVLGETLAQIAAEKAGIIKPGRPVVLAPQREEARLVVERIAKERGAPLIQVGRDFFFAPVAHSLDGQTFVAWGKDEHRLVTEFIESGGQSKWEPVRLHIPLLGHHQVENAATAYAALLETRKLGLNVPDSKILRGFDQVYWPGRFEIISRDPLIILDSAHNRDSALKLRLALDDYLPGRPVILVFGASEDKDIHGMFSELLPRIEQVVATESTHPRAVSVERLVELAYQFGRSAHAVVPIENALLRAAEIAGHDHAILITGSLFVVAAARHVLLNDEGVRAGIRERSGENKRV